MTIYIDYRLWDILIEEFRKTYVERGYYLVGFRYHDNFYVYEAFEFAYSDQSEVFIESDPLVRMFLINTLPAGLNILGVIHSHPFDTSDSPEPSSIDIALCREYEEEIVLTVSRTGGVKAIVFNGDIAPLEVKIKKFDSERPHVIRVKIPYTYFCVFPYFVSQFEKKLYIPKIIAEHIYRIYLAGRYNGKKLTLPKFLWVWIKQIFALPHKFQIDQIDETMRYIKHTSFSKIVYEGNTDRIDL